MFTSADLIEVLRRRRRRSIRPEAAVDGLPPGWTAWLSAMRVRADAVTGATATAIIELLAARPPVPRTRLPVPANRFQAWAGLRYPLWEPPPRDHPLLALPNFVATPHIGAATAESMERMGMAVVSDVAAVLAGAAPRHRVV